ncbi:MAG: hypothetical protein ACKOYC_09190 [Bacteroidota bacterium]
MSGTSMPTIVSAARSLILRLVVLVFVLLTSNSAYSQFYQGYQTTFGKNRVQHQEFFWTFYRFKNFDTYFYLGGKEHARFIGEHADKEIERVEQLFDFRATGRMQFIIFNKYSDMKQSNIGLEGDEMSGNTGGLTRVVGNKVLVYFDGDHEQLLEQIRAGVSQVLFHQLMYGGNVKDRLQSAVLLTVPEWYEKGLIAYVSKGWGPEQDVMMRDGFINKDVLRFSRMPETEAEFAGHSMWNYITNTYGQTSIANLLYMTRVNRSIENGFSFVLGMNLKRLMRSWQAYYLKYYEQDISSTSNPERKSAFKTKSSRTYDFARLSPDGRYLAYVANEIGRYKVFVTDLETGKRRRIMKGGYKTLQQKPDRSFPVLAWHPTGRFVSVIREKKGNIWLEYHHQDRKQKAERSKFLYFDKVLQMSYAPNGQDLVMSGVQNGITDIFVYNTRSRTATNITQDYFDDLYPVFSKDGKQIYFSSNRDNDTLGASSGRLLGRENQLDLFATEYPKRDSVLTRITSTPFANETWPLALDSGRVYYLSDESGINNLFMATIDSMLAYVDTAEHYRPIVVNLPQSNHKTAVLEHHQSRSRYVETVFENGKYQVLQRPTPQPIFADTIKPTPTQTRKLLANKKTVKESPGSKATVVVNPVVEQQKNDKPAADTTKIDIDNYIFQSEFKKPGNVRKSDQRPQENAQPQVVGNDSTANKGDQVFVVPDSILTRSKRDTFWLPKQRNYEVAFSTDYFVTQLDNSLQNSTYQAYTGGAFYFDPGLNALLKVGVSDLMDDYKISGGVRLSGDFNSNEYFLGYENLKHKVDRSLAFSRQAREYIDGFTYVKVHTHEGKGILKYPFNDLSSLRGSLSIRNDRVVTLATDFVSLSQPTAYDYWGSLKAEYVYDNTLNKGLNLLNGMRYKVFAEAFRQIDRSSTWLGVVGVDFRHYQKIHRQIIWASRFAASSSFGDQKIVYYLGSQDNAIVPSDIFDYSIPVDPKQRFGFQAIATNMRGFIQNIRNGNNFALINNEIRFPVFHYLLNRPIRSDFVRNFQVVGFFDVGSAWNGPDPYSKDNYFNTEVISGNPVTVVLDRQVEPIVAGFGGGLRSRLFGYFLRADWGWGYEDGIVRDPVFYLSLGLDF